MPRLLDVPNEILLQIIAHTNLEDIESFAGCNKRIRLLFGPVLQLHLERKMNYLKTEFGIPQSQFRSPHAILLLRDVLESPAIAQYPTKVVVGDCVDGLENWPDWSLTRHHEELIEIRDTIVQCTDLLAAKVDACPYIKASEKQQWKGEIGRGSECTAVAFLIMLFPNLKSIIVSDASFYLGRVSDAVRNIAAGQQKLPESSHPLQKLATVRLERSGRPSQAWFDFLEPFTGLRSVRLLTGKMVQGLHRDWGCENENDDSDEDSNESEDANDDRVEDKDSNEGNGLEDEDGDEDSDEDTNESEDVDDDGQDDEDHYEDNDDGEKDAKIEEEYERKIGQFEGGITCLSFMDSAIDAGSFNKVLRGTEALQTFEYNFDPNSSHLDPTIWQPALLIRYLLLYASHSLVSLNLTGIKGCSWNVHGDDDIRYAKTPRQFRVLKQMYIQDGIFVEGKGRLFSPQSATKPWWTITKHHQMGDVLPASLEELTLFPSFDHGDQITDVFRGFPESKEHRLPRLNDIKLGGGLQLDENVKLTCEKVGTSVVEL